MKYVNPKIEALIQNGVNNTKRVGEYLLVGVVTLLPTIGLVGCSSKDNYFNQQRDNAVHAVQNTRQQEESPIPEYSSTPQPEQTVEVNPDLASTPEFRETSQIEPVQTPNQSSNSYKKTDIGMGLYLVEGDFNGDGLPDKAIQDSEGTYHTFFGRFEVDRIVSAQAVNQYQGTDGTKNYNCVQVQFQDSSGNALNWSTDTMFPERNCLHNMNIIEGSVLKYPIVVLGLGVKEDNLGEIVNSLK